MPSTEIFPSRNKSKVALVVLGMHRSGTSALTHALSALGAELPRDPLPKLEHNNPEGFWESAEVLGVNDTLLQEIGTRWDDWSRTDLNKLTEHSRSTLAERARNAVQRNFQDAPLIALKDPRICRVFPFWRKVLQSCGYSVAPVLIVRNPIEVGRSLAARDDFSLQKSIALWLRHVLDAEIETRDSARSIVTYDQLISTPIPVLRKIAGDLGLSTRALQKNYRAKPILKSDQRHHAVPADELGHSKVTSGWAQDAYHSLVRMATAAIGDSELGALDRIRANFEASLDVFGPLMQSTVELEQKAARSDELRARIEHGTRNLQSLKSRLEGISSAALRSRLQIQKSQGTIHQCTQQLESHRHNIGRLARLIGANLSRLDGMHAVLSRMPSPVASRRSRLSRFVYLIAVMLKLRGMIASGKWRETTLLLFHIARHDLFDHGWYMARYRVPRGSYTESLAHWLGMGWKEGYSPCPEFDVRYYLEANQDISASGLNPLLHYLQHGAREYRSCGFYLDTSWYARINSDIPDGAVHALTHYRHHGRHEGRQPNALFDPHHYLLQRPLLDLGDCLSDYILLGSLLNLSPSPNFHPGSYRSHRLLDQPADQEPLEHCLRTWQTLAAGERLEFELSSKAKQLLEFASSDFMTPVEQDRRSPADTQDHSTSSRSRQTEGEPKGQHGSSKRDPILATIEDVTFLSACVSTFKSLVPKRIQPKLRLSLLRKNLHLTSADFSRVCAAFDMNYYLASYPELATMDCPAIEHYLRNGWREGRNPTADFNTAYYLEQNRDIARGQINPFVHWVLHGRAERRPAIPHKARLSAQHYLPLVTCIVPNFNHEPFLRKRLNSILSQTYPRVELLILDDCSTDGSRAIIEEFARTHPDRIRTVYNETCSGSVFRQWQKGAALAKGELTWICESDDYCEPDFLTKLVPLFSDRSVQLAFGRIQFCDQEGIPFPGLDSYREQAEAGIWSEIRIMPACRWFRGAFGARNVIPNVGGCLWRSQKLPDRVWQEAVTYKVVGDWYLYSMLAAGGQIAWNPCAVAYFRQHRKNTSVTSFRSDGYYLEHHKFMASLQAQWGLPRRITKSFHNHLMQHSVALEGRCAVDKLDKFVKLDELNSIKRQQDHVLIAFLGFHPGGGEFFPIRLANALHAHGMRVSILALDMGRVNKSMLHSVARGIPVYDAAYLSEYGVDQFLEDAGVTLIHSHMVSVEWYFFGKEKMRTRLPYVVTMHGSYESSPLKPVQLEPLVRNVTRWIYLADKNLVPLQRLAIPPERLVKLPNAVPPDERPFPRSRQEMDIEDDAVVFTLVARGIRRKGWRAAICAYLKLRQQFPARPVHLILAGEGSYVDELATRHGHEQGIHFVGFQSCIQGLYKISDVALVPTRFEGESFPLCIIEAFMSGIPVIATDIGEIPGMVAPNDVLPGGLLVEQIRNTGVFVDRVSSAMAEMLDDKTRSKLTTGAIKLASKYDMDTLTKRYEQEYRMAIKAAPPVQQGEYRDNEPA